MSSLIKSEFYYLSKDIKYFVFLGIIAVGYIVNAFLRNDLLLAFLPVLAEVFVCVIILEFSHKDFKYKTMKNYVGCGRNLFKVYFAKLIVCLTAILSLYILSKAGNIIVSTIMGTLEENSSNALLVALDIIISILQSVVIFFICSAIRNGVFAILASVTYIIVVPAILSASKMINNEILDAIKPFTSFNLSERVSGKSVEGISVINNIPDINGDFVIHFIVCIVVIAALTCLGAYLYSLRKVK